MCFYNGGGNGALGAVNCGWNVLPGGGSVYHIPLECLPRRAKEPREDHLPFVCSCSNCLYTLFHLDYGLPVHASVRNDHDRFELVETGRFLQEYDGYQYFSPLALKIHSAHKANNKLRLHTKAP